MKPANRISHLVAVSARISAAAVPMLIASVSHATVLTVGPDKKFLGTTGDDVMIVQVNPNACPNAGEYQFKLNGVSEGCHPIARHLVADGMPGDDQIIIRNGVYVPKKLHLIGGQDNDLLRVGQWDEEGSCGDMGGDMDSEVTLITELSIALQPDYCVEVGGNVILSAGPGENTMAVNSTSIGGTLDYFDGNDDGIARLYRSRVEGTTDVALAKGNDRIWMVYSYLGGTVRLGPNAGDDTSNIKDNTFGGDVLHNDGLQNDKSVYCNNTWDAGALAWTGGPGNDKLVVDLYDGTTGTANGNSGTDEYKGNSGITPLTSIEIDKTGFSTGACSS
jgi:hypothetical protein